MNIREIPEKLSFTDILVQMIETVEEMHSFGFIHQNIKPDNFRIMNNRVVLIDFGLTKRFFDGDGKRNKLWRLGF